MTGFSGGAPGPAGPGEDRRADATSAPDIAFPGAAEQIEIVENQVVSGVSRAGAPSADAPPAPNVQYFLPPGRFLPPNRWRRHDHRLVWVVSVIAALIIAALTVGALVLGALNQYRFTASGAVQVDCTTRTALGDPSIGRDARVEIFATESGKRVADTLLDGFTDVEAGAGACFLTFRVDRVTADGDGYLVQIGSAPGQLLSRAELERGVRLGR